jgi:hypothetical protein
MIRGRRLLLLIGALAAATASVEPARGAPDVRGRAAKRPPAIQFLQEPRRNRIRIVTAGYELAFSNKNGSLLSLLSRPDHARLLAGQNGCLWAARADGVTDYIGGCAYSRAGANRFSYRWDKATTTLTLTYAGDPAAPHHASATVQLTARPTFLDLRLTLENHWQRPLWSGILPADLYAPSAAVSAGYAPNFLPGVRLGPGFFTGVHENVLTYPGRWGFADYLSLDLASTHLALYSVNPEPAPIHPIELGFVHGAPGQGCSGRTFCITHSFNTWIADGQTWTSPIVRLRIGEPVDRTLAEYRHDNGLDLYPSVADKLGARFAQYAQAPLIKADARKGLPPLSEWATELRRLPSPAILHPVHFTPGAFDATDPDFLPPDPAVGTTDEMRAMIDAAHALGLFVMPYLNVSWWNVDSPTVRDLLAHGNAKQFAALDNAGRPIVEPYHDFSGYVVSPHAPAVRDRIAALLAQWQSDAPTDCYFFDQIGARAWVRDFNPAAPDPLSYGDGWLSLMSPYANRCLMVEDGWDRLARSFSAFHGGLLVVQRETADQDYLYGAGNWQPFPLAPFLLHDKVLFFQHDLSELTMTRDDETLAWNMAFGYMLSYSWELAPDDDTLANPWLDLVGSFQRAIGPFVAGQPLEGYTYITPRVTQTAFPSLTVVTNWATTDDTYITNGYGIPPEGFLARSTDGALVAGTFRGTFDGFALSPGTHHLLVHQTASAIVVHQPLGDDTELAVKLPPSWNATQAVTATAYAPDGQTLGPVAGRVQSGHFVFECAGPGFSGFAPTYRLTVG